MSRSTEWVRAYCDLQRSLKSLRVALRDAAAPHQLSDAEALILFLCADQGTHHLSQRQLAAVTGMSPAAVSGHLESLRQRDLVIGARDPEDRRRQTWTASKSAQAIVQQIDQALSTTEANTREAA